MGTRLVSVHGWGIAVAIAWSLAGARAARADDALRPVRVAVDVTASGPCGASDVARAIAQRVRRPVLFTADAPTRVGVRFAEDGVEVAAEIAFEGASGKDTRSVSGHSCDEVSAAAAVVAATWLEGEPARAAEPPPGALRAEPSGPAASRLAAGSPATPKAEAAAEAPGGPSRSAEDARWLFGAHGVASAAIVNGVVLGGQVGLGRSFGRHVELRAFLRGAVVSETQAQGTAQLAFGTVPIDACVRAPVARTVAVGACARVEPGFVRIDYVGVGLTRPWLGAGPGVRARWSLAPVALEVEAFAPAQALGYDVRAGRANPQLFRAFSASFAAGVVLPIP